MSRDISAEKSSIEEQPSGSISINQVVSFKVVAVDKKGNRVTFSPKGKGIISFVVEVTLNGNQQQQAKIEKMQGNEGEFSVSFKVTVVDKKGNRVTSSPKGKGIFPFVVEITLNGKPQHQVKIEENQGKEGEFSVSFAPTTAGQHQISVSHKGKHFKGSPFRIDFVDRPRVVPYRRDYNAVGTNPVLRFGSEGSGDGQFGRPYGVACNSRGDIIVVADSYNH